MAELPTLGEQCGLASCRQLDFLPIACQHCARSFCRDHASADAHGCDKRPEPAQADLSSNTRIYACHVSGCGAAELTPVVCPDCGRGCCLAHRHPAGHGCAAWQAQQADAARRLPEFQRAAALQAERLSAAPVVVNSGRSERARKTARQVQLMRLKQRAAGAGSVPLADRRYLLLVAPGGRGAPRPVFVSRRWTLGRAVDALADLCGASNNNDRTGGRRLLLYRYTDGGRIGDAMDTVIEELPDGQMDNAETVVLEYGDPADTHRSDVTKYELK
ncbi:AN1-type zinc finger protein 1-like [Amphibalanus amphitrite]|uniref:AN1-type zinc finger protein 1-like n=1 Tax=Amphibalanus amphitrite TaxID=1232801 RepID=UPI001C919115|nr:AN1-type zinc finger protein 1-like [Amphibalanus amphitrite]XP_043239847.1 AN1-type zinc finger protein 1-like [Amphibalanus amphitrite]XP_043239857.1 AN1-type zinc finger protein 1-like [Amphibalanus amphitrite]XP_043239866.1 AN1-type zinc finger protein 1-like [Amphibalanus amphitrite]